MARTQKTIWVVDCAKLGRELEALDKAPFPGKLGERIFENVSKQGWEMWPAHATLLINHYGLNMADPRAQDVLFKEMETFYFDENAGMPEGYTPPGAAPAKK